MGPGDERPASTKPAAPRGRRGAAAASCSRRPAAAGVRPSPASHARQAPPRKCLEFGHKGCRWSNCPLSGQPAPALVKRRAEWSNGAQIGQTVRGVVKQCAEWSNGARSGQTVRGVVKRCAEWSNGARSGQTARGVVKRRAAGTGEPRERNYAKRTLTITGPVAVTVTVTAVETVEPTARRLFDHPDSCLTRDRDRGSDRTVAVTVTAV